MKWRGLRSFVSQDNSHAFEPNDPTTPGIWQGPVCFNVNGADCGFDISLIEGVELTFDQVIGVTMPERGEREKG